MRFVELKPANPETGICDKHGEFEFRYQKLGERYLVNDQCGRCAAEMNAAQDAADQQRRAAEEKTRLERKRCDAGVALRYVQSSFRDFRCETPEQASALADVQTYFKDIGNGGNGNLIMSGNVGTGKTMLASAGINQLLTQGRRCKIAKLGDIVRQVKDSWQRQGGKTETDIIREYVGLDFLVIDEVGQQRGTETETLLVFEIIDGRYQAMLPTMLISNLDRRGITDAIGERAFDRLRQDGGKLVAFNWSSMRKAG